MPGVVEGGGRSRLVVILQEPHQPVLILERRSQMLADWPHVTVVKAIVQALVVGVVEALLVHLRFTVPIHFGHETEFRRAPAHPLRRLGPEQWRTTTPG